MISHSIDGDVHLRAVAVGEVTLQAIRRRARGRVIAKFERSLYVRFENGAFVGIGTQSIGAGPLNVLLVQRDWLRLRNVSLMQAVEAGDGALAFGAQRIVLDGAARWHPGRAIMRREQFSMRLRALTARAERRVPAAGLGRLAFSADVSDADPVLHLAGPAWDALARWLAHAVTDTEAAREPEPVTATLIGLGPGLTPSGDDVFCGVLVALKLLGLDHAARALWSWLLAHLDERTSELSAAHLRAAAIGHGHAALHAVLECGADDEGALDAALCRLARIGHCSGWDALAGIALVWRALAAQELTRRVASSAA
jgi:hypothetical protein